ncbi:hypothetical protein ACHAXR_007340, partial [Thalassiosira sp. AJA248-18]
TTVVQASYLGPTHCTKPGSTATAVIQSTSKGYSTFNHLLFDMVSLATSFKSGQLIADEQLKFKICPGTVIDLDDTSLPLGFLPIEVPRLTLQCGDHGNRGKDPNGNDSCIIRGGGKRNPNSKEWNTYPQRSFKNSASGILGGGSVAQIYVYGESAYEVTLKGLTFDNSLSRSEVELYREYISQFGKEYDDNNNDGLDGGGTGWEGRDEEKIEAEYDASVPSTWGVPENNKLKENRDNKRHLQQDDNENAAQPAHRFASVAVRGKGYGDDAGPRLITIEDCRFVNHRGYAILVSPGIQQPELPVAPEFEFPMPPSSSSNNGDVPSVNLQSSGAIYSHNNDGTLPQDGGGNDNGGNNRRRKRRLNLLDNGGKYIPRDGQVSYYDNTAGKNYHDGRRVKIVKTEFDNNIISGENVAGLITSAYSLTLVDCFFSKNDAKAMVFVYNNEALVDNTIFAENTVEVSTVIMASPKGSKPLVEAIKKKNGEEDGTTLDTPVPTHIVERTCFLGSHVGMSNVLVTDVANTGFGQRDNHARGTKFTWTSTCEGGAAESFGHECLETGRCDGTCVQFTSEKCMSDRLNSREYEMFFNGGSRYGLGLLVWGATLGVAVVLGAGVLC